MINLLIISRSFLSSNIPTNSVRKRRITVYGVLGHSLRSAIGCQRKWSSRHTSFQIHRCRVQTNLRTSVACKMSCIVPVALKKLSECQTNLFCRETFESPPRNKFLSNLVFVRERESAREERQTVASDSLLSRNRRTSVTGLTTYV